MRRGGEERGTGPFFKLFCCPLLYSFSPPLLDVCFGCAPLTLVHRSVFSSLLRCSSSPLCLCDPIYLRIQSSPFLSRAIQLIYLINRCKQNRYKLMGGTVFTPPIGRNILHPKWFAVQFSWLKCHSCVKIFLDSPLRCSSTQCEFNTERKHNPYLYRSLAFDLAAAFTYK